MTFWVAIRNVLVTLLTIAVISALVVADWYLRHAPARKAERLLMGQSIAVNSDSAVSASADGRIFILEQLELAGIRLKKAGDDGTTPLMAAIRAGNRSSVDFLLGRTGIAETLNEAADPDGFRPLEAVLRAGDFGLASRLIELGADPNIELTRGNPALLEACRNEDRATFEFLLEAGADPNVTDDRGVSPLLAAIERHDGQSIGNLLDAGADPNQLGPSGDPILVEVIGRGNDDLADLLLREGAGPDQVGASGETALLTAIRAGDVLSAEVLLDHGADPDGAGIGETMPLEVATASQDVVAMDLLIQYGADGRARDLLRRTVEDRNVPGLKVLLDSGADPAEMDGEAERILDRAMADGAMEIARALLEAGAKAEGKLWPALDSGHEELVEMVLLYGARVSEPGPDGESALDFALENSNGRLASLLLENGADPNVFRENGEAWLAAAVRTGDMVSAEALLQHGACIDDITCKDGHSLLGWAIARKNTGLAKRLIQLGADVRSREPAPASSEFREQFARSKTFRWHLQSDSRINPLMLAAAQGDRDIAKALVDAGAKKGEYSRRYLWPINIAAWHMDVPMMQIILGRDPDPENQPRKLVVDLSSQRVTLYKNGRAAYSSRVSTGKSGYRTKKGTFIISDKHRHHNSSIYGSSMPYFMRLSCGDFGLHQGNVPNYPASHGCIRVPYAGAKNLFYACEVGDIVVIQQ